MTMHVYIYLMMPVTVYFVKDMLAEAEMKQILKIKISLKLYFGNQILNNVNTLIITKYP